MSLCPQLRPNVESRRGDVVARVEGLVFPIKVISRLGTSHDLERDHLVQVLRRNLRQHLGNRWLEHAVVAVGVVGRDVAEKLEASRLVRGLGVPRVGDTEKVHRPDVVLAFPCELHDRFDPLGELLDAFLRNFRNPAFLFDSGRLRHDSPLFRWVGMCYYRAIMTRLCRYKRSIFTIGCQA